MSSERWYLSFVISGLESARLKLVRAGEHLDALEQRIRTYSRAASHQLIAEPNGKHTVHIGDQPPPDIGILVGEIVYQLRSSLDHLAFDLVKINSRGIVLPAGWEKRCEFPLLFSIPTKGNPPVPCKPLPRDWFDKTLPGISDEAFTTIESLQPYRRLGVTNALRLIADLSNIDKHRHLHVTVAKVAVNRHYQLRDGTRHDSTRGGFEDGAQIELPDEDIHGVVEVKITLLPYVTFDEPTVGDGVATLEVENVLKVCLQAVADFVVPAFDKLLKNP
jgi:hypothetical protein